MWKMIGGLFLIPIVIGLFIAIMVDCNRNLSEAYDEIKHIELMLGQSVIIDNDTLKFEDKSIFTNTFLMSNGTRMDFADTSKYEFKDKYWRLKNE